MKHLEKTFQEMHYVSGRVYLSQVYWTRRNLPDDILISLRVEVSVTHVMFPVGDCHINGLVTSVIFHLMTCLKISTFPL